MTLVNYVYMCIEEDDDDQSEEIKTFYNAATKEQQFALDVAFMYLTGYSLSRLIIDSKTA